MGVDNEWSFPSLVRRLYGASDGSSVSVSVPSLSHSLQPRDCSTPGLPVHHQLPEPTQTHVHWVSDAISYLILCHPLLFLPSIFPNIRIFFKEVSSSHQVAKVSELQFQHQSCQWIFRFDVLQDWLVWSPCHLRDSQESSPTPQFKRINQWQFIIKS